MNNKLVIKMINDGWNLNDIRELVNHSKEVEKQLVLNRQYENRHKITDFKGVKKYYCNKHDCFHYKYRNTTVNGKRIQVKTDSFKLCKDNAYKLSDSEMFKRQFKNSLKNYSVKAHKKIIGSRAN